MTPGPSLGGDAAGGADLDRALDSYSGFLAHQLAEVVVLLGADDAGARPLAAARARLDRMLADLHDLRPAPRDPSAVELAALAFEIAAQLSEPGRQIRIRASGDLPMVEGDPGLLRALLGHLLRTAVTRSPSGAALELRGAVRADGRVDIRLEQPCEEGVASDAAQSLTPFERPAGTGPLLGAGVSGPAAARIVQAHGGALEVRSAGDCVVTVFDLAAAGS